MSDKEVVTFGEVMLRLSPPDRQRIVEADSFKAVYGGASANVAIALSYLGKNARFVTSLPENAVGDACLNSIRQHGVDVSSIIRDPGRLGIYFLEMGAMQRGNKTIYDRNNSAFATHDPEGLDWEEIFEDAEWFHWTGIAPAVSENAADSCLEAVKKAQEMDVAVSCDINYRSKLWNWGKSAEEVMSELVQYVDVAIGNEEDADKTFGISAPGTEVKKGKIDPEGYKKVHNDLRDRFPNIKIVASTLRESISANHNKWSAVISDGESFYHSSKYDLTHIVDRVGGGDSFAAGLIYGLTTFEDKLEKALEFAVATSALKHSMYGDSPKIQEEEVETLMEGVTSGRISR